MAAPGRKRGPARGILNRPCRRLASRDNDIRKAIDPRGGEARFSRAWAGSQPHDRAQTDVRPALIQRQLGIDDLMAIVREMNANSRTKSAKSPSHTC
jgi:hypothetical protein